MTDNHLQDLLTPGSDIRLLWLGNLSWMMRLGGRLWAVDLDLETDVRVHTSPISTLELAPHLDVHVITHWHGDHLSSSTCALLVEHSDCLFLLPANCQQKARQIGIPEERIQITRPDEPFDLLDVHVRPHRALHGEKNFTVYRHASFDDCGYLFEVGGKLLFQPGDTVLLEQHLDLQDIDVLFVSPTVHNMYIDRAAILIHHLEPRRIFAQHFGTYSETEDNLFWTRGYPDELKSALMPRLRDRFCKPVMGQLYVID
jgi:L-ascorbate 6-phosphate lactonase